jgi:arginyl-tRNA synthetase
MTSARDELLDALRAAVAEVSPGHGLEVTFETPRQAAHGDLAVTAAMPLAKAQKRNPREVANELIAALKAKSAVERWVEAIDVAGPGFINLHLRASARQRVVAQVLEAGAAFGRRTGSADDAVLVEFVSANPTGPLHVGHARQAALGDAICNLLETQGRRVVREFYYNDAGMQIATLAASVKARIDGRLPGGPGWPESAYNGDYIADIAADFLAGKTVAADDRAFTASGRTDDLEGIREFAVAYLRHEQDLDLAAFGVRFDNHYLESSLYADGRVERTVERLVASGKTYEEGGALWLRSTDYGDDKDRVMRKSDGSFTYFVPDVAYHLAKFERGFRQAINIQGTDHHGTIARVRAGLQAADPQIPKTYPEYVLNTMVRVERGGVEVKISKRAGHYVTLRDLIEWTGRDAVRFFMLGRKADTEFTFDVDLALKQNDENPVFYVQYAHARICSVLEQYAGRGDASVPGADPVDADLERLVAPSETVLMKKLADFPEVLATAASGLAPHEITFYLRDLAAAFHSYYAAERFLVDDPALARARIALLAATRQVIRNALAVLGVSAPERMVREAETETA